MLNTTLVQSPEYACNGATVNFNTAFEFQSNSEVVVVLKLISSSDAVIQSEGVAYTVSGANKSGGGVVTMLAAPSDLYVLYILRSTYRVQPYNLRNTGRFNPETYEDALDNMAQQLQELEQGTPYIINDSAPPDELNPPADGGGSTVGNKPGPQNSTNLVNTQTVNAYVPAIPDAWGLVEMDYPTANSFTLPPNSAVPYLLGTAIHIAQRGAGQTTIAAGSGVTIRCAATLLIRARFGIAVAYYRGNNEWYVGGDLSLTSFVADPSPPATQVLTVPTGYYWYTRYLRFNVDGSISKVDVSGVTTAFGRWHSGAPVASDYQIYCQQTGGDMERQASAARNAWLSLTSPRQWEVENSTSTKYCTIRVSIKQLSTGLIVSNTYTLDRRVSA